MNIYSYLKRDHRKVSGLMNELLAANDNDTRAELFEKIKFELLMHSKTEQDTFYKALEEKNKVVGEKIDEAEDEHKEIEAYIKKLEKLEFGSEKWIEQFGEFRHSITHHIKEEEEGIFEKAKKVLSDKKAEDLAEEMDELKHTTKYQQKAIK